MEVLIKSDRFTVWALMFALITISILPLMIVDIPPLADYPNHLARVYVLSHLDDVPGLSEYYRNVMMAQPNLAFDLIVELFEQWVPLEAAGRIFAGLTILSMVSGVLLLHHAIHQRVSPWPLLAFFFVYNRLYLWGFLGYLFTLGCALSAFAAWIMLRERPAVRFLCATLMATLLYLGHLYAFGIYALSVAGYELATLPEKRSSFWTAFGKSALSAVQFFPAAYLFLFVSPTGEAAGMTYWGSAWRKVEGLANVIYNYNLAFDLACLAIIAALFGIGLITKRMSVKWFMLGPVGLLVLAFLIMPDRLFSSYGADKRIPIAVALIAIAACDWQQWRMRPAVIGCLVALFVSRITLLTDVWAKSDAIYDEITDALYVIPKGAKLLVVVAHPDERSLPDIPLFEIGNMAIIERDAFVPSLFTYPDDAGQAVAFTDELDDLADDTPGHIVWPSTLSYLSDPDYAARSGPFRPDLLARYDYALIVNGKALPPASKAPDGERLVKNDLFEIIKLRNSASTSKS